MPVRCTDEMVTSADAIPADFDRITGCASDAVDAVEPAAQRLVAEVPLRSRVLEVGCGTGTLARELAARRGARVTAIDLSPRMIDVARVRTPASLGIEYCVADFLALSPTGFDVVIAVNTLHHLPLGEGAARMAAGVRPGGKVLIADLFAARGLAWLLRAERADAAHLATLAQIRCGLRSVLPGVRVRRHLGGRYTACWTK